MKAIGAILAAAILLGSATADARPVPETPRARAAKVARDDAIFLTDTQIGNLGALITNYGRFGDAATARQSSMEWPIGSENDYLYEGRLWFGAKVNGAKLVSQGDDPLEWGTGPASLDEIQEIADERSRSDYDTYCAFTDAPGNSNPLGIRVKQRTSTWALSDLDDIIVYDMTFVNESGGDLSACYVGFSMDCDVSSREGSENYLDDLVGYTRYTPTAGGERFISYAYDSDHPSIPGDDTGGPAGQSTGYIGMSPLRIVDASGNDLPAIPKTHYRWDWNHEPGVDELRYDYMASGEYLAIPPSPFDYKFLQAFGPFEIPAGKSIRIIFAFGLGIGLDGLRANMDAAHDYFRLNGAATEWWETEPLFVVPVGSIDLPTVSARAGGIVEYPVRATLADARSAQLALVFDSALLAVEPDLIAGHAFGGSVIEPEWSVFGDTLLLVFASQSSVSLDDETLAVLRFRVNPSAPPGSFAPIVALPYPRTNIDEGVADVTGGGIAVTSRRYGDVNASGDITAGDASLILRYVVQTISPIDVAVADVTGNGSVTAFDAAQVLKKVVAPLYVFPVEGGALPRPASATTRILTWVRDAAGWMLAIDDATGVLGADFALEIPDGAVVSTVTGSGHLAFAQTGGVIRVALARDNGESRTLFHIACPSLKAPPSTRFIELNEGAIPVSDIALPPAVSLFRNVPNPFNPSTTIHYAIARTSDVRLTVCDVNGRIVRVLVAGHVAAGAHEVVWDGRDEAGRPVASGVYVYRLIAKDEVMVRRMTLAR